MKSYETKEFKRIFDDNNYFVRANTIKLGCIRGLKYIK